MEQQSNRIRLILLIVFSIALLFIFINIEDIFVIIFDSLSLWLFKIYPPIFIFYIFGNIIISSNVLNFKNHSIIKFFGFTSTNSLAIYNLSFIIGNPATSALIKKQLIENNIKKEDGNLLLCISSFLNPLFIYSVLIQNDVLSTYILPIILASFVSNFIIMLLLKKNKNLSIYKNEQISKQGSFISNVFTAIEQANYLLIKICGIIVVCNLIKFAFINICSSFALDANFLAIILSPIEVSSGLLDIVTLEISLIKKVLICAFLIGFSGIAIHLQVYAIIANTGLDFKKYLLSRITQGILTTILVACFFYLHYLGFTIISIILILIAKQGQTKRKKVIGLHPIT